MPDPLVSVPFSSLTPAAQLGLIYQQARDFQAQALSFQRSVTMAFANLAAQEDVELSDLTALGTATDSLLSLFTVTTAALTALQADAALAPDAAIKLQAIIDQTNGQLAKIQAALPVAPVPPAA